MYYDDKIDTIKDIFGVEEVKYEKDAIIIGDKLFPILNDVIILLDPSDYSNYLKSKLSNNSTLKNNKKIAEDIQFTFGEEWKKYNKILPEHNNEFNNYFDLINIDNLADKRVCDLGCGIGRWAYFLHKNVREMILIDFSDAIFEARKNLIDSQNSIFLMADLKQLPLREKFADFMYCIGVLHHLPSPAIDEVRALSKFSNHLLIYLYYSIDNKPLLFRFLFRMVTLVRFVICRIRNQFIRSIITEIFLWLIYIPLIGMGYCASIIGLEKYIPLFEGYKGNSLNRIRQDIYDRIFTRIEQRFSRKDIYELNNTFSKIIISCKIPYWHFTCEK